MKTIAFFMGIIFFVIGIVGLQSLLEGDFTTKTDTIFLDAPTSESPINTSTPVSSQNISPTATATAVAADTGDAQEGSGDEVQLTAVPTQSYYYYGYYYVQPVLGIHVVQPGEHFYCIGRAYKVKPTAIASYNGFEIDDFLPVGTALMVPDSPWENIVSGIICDAQFQIDSVQNPESTIEPSPASEPNDTPTAMPAESKATPTPVVERRQIEVRIPNQMTLGESLEVELAFRPDRIDFISPGNGISSAPTPMVNRNTFSLLNQVNQYQNHTLFATAQLVGAGFDISPTSEVRQMVRLDEEVKWHWSIKPTEAERQTLIVSLRLDYEPNNESVQPLQFSNLWSSPYVVDVRSTMFNLTVRQHSTVTFLSLVLGSILTVGQQVVGIFRKSEE